MAKFYSAALPEETPKSKRRVRQSLSEVDSLVVLHSVAWQSRRNGRQADGEADFIVLMAQRGILILEVKGGGVEIIDGVWYSTDARNMRHKIKNPFHQAKDSKYALLTYLRSVDATLSHIPIVHAVVFPDIVVQAGLGPEAPRQLIIDRASISVLRTLF